MNREQRKAIFIAKATTHFDTPEIRKEAEEMFEKANPIIMKEKPKCKECDNYKNFFGMLKPDIYMVYEEGISKKNFDGYWDFLGEWKPARTVTFNWYKCSNGHEWCEKIRLIEELNEE